MNNALVFYLRREAYDIGDISDKTITVDKLIEELKLAKDTLGVEDRKRGRSKYGAKKPKA